jgi:dolichol-phosphate mannosyltransferase
MIATARKLSVILPTYREAQNIRPVCERVCAACAAAGLDAEIIIVDDNSQDGTEQVAAELAEQLPVRLIVRRNERGLATAVMAGFDAATADTFLVMDADLQHPPERVPAIAAPVLDDGADIAVGSRYVTEGRSAEEWPVHRRLNSFVATFLARGLTDVKDCMAGFFCVRRDVVERAGRLSPVGYKILLELLARAAPVRVQEVPIHFSTRVAGESKLSLAEQLRYLRHLGRLYRECRPVTFYIAVLFVLAAMAVAVWLLL